MTTVSWAQRTGEQVIWAARSVINDIDPNRYAITAATALTLYRHCLVDTAIKINWKSDQQVAITLAVGEYTKAYPSASASEILTWSDGFWDEMGSIVDRRPPEEVRGWQNGDLQVGTIAKGIPRYWSFERTATAVTLLFYPAPALAGTFRVYTNELAKAANDPTTLVPFDWSATQTLETCLALRMAAQLAPDQLARLGMGDGAVALLSSQYQSRLSDERWRAGANRRQNRVVIRGA